jgi:hypothetical protein
MRTEADTGPRRGEEGTSSAEVMAASAATMPQQHHSSGRHASWSHVTCPTTREHLCPCSRAYYAGKPLQRCSWRLPVAR